LLTLLLLALWEVFAKFYNERLRDYISNVATVMAFKGRGGGGEGGRVF
jgi:hypothetical protein